MNKMKNGIAAFAVALAAAAAFAIPGVKAYAPDMSGEYVYYKDSSFKRESIIGFICYDEGTYGARCFTEVDIENQLPEKDITIYFSVDPTKDKLELTGERIVGSTGSNEDTDIVNYLHDLVYEFAERRQKVTIESAKPVRKSDDFPQFGGSVTMVYNPLVPVFNVESIITQDGTAIMEVQTIGALSASGDQSFTTFRGLEAASKDKNRKFKKKSLAKKQTATYETQSIEIDDMWTQNMENVWFLGDTALLMLNDTPVPEMFDDTEEHKGQFREILVRNMSESKDGSFAVWKNRTIETSADGKTTTLMNTFCQLESGDVTRDFKVLTDLGGTYAILSLTVFDSVYQKNKAYFKKILSSYTTSNGR